MFNDAVYRQFMRVHQLLAARHPETQLQQVILLTLLRRNEHLPDVLGVDVSSISTLLRFAYEERGRKHEQLPSKQQTRHPLPG